MAEKEPEKKTNRLRNELREQPVSKESDSLKSTRSKKKADDIEFEISEPVRKKPKEENETPRNKPRNIPAPEKSKDKQEAETKEEKPSGPGFLNRLRNDEKLHRIVGAFLVFIVTPYLAVAFVSYFFTWHTDQDKVMGPVSEFAWKIRRTHFSYFHSQLVWRYFILVSVACTCCRIETDVGIQSASIGEIIPSGIILHCIRIRVDGICIPQQLVLSGRRFRIRNQFMAQQCCWCNRNRIVVVLQRSYIPCSRFQY
jgi:hypothetical protein